MMSFVTIIVLVLAAVTFPYSIAGASKVGSRCRLSSDCGRSMVCRWMANACGYGICTCANGLQPLGEDDQKTCGQHTPLSTATFDSSTGPRQTTARTAAFGESCHFRKQCQQQFTCLGGNCQCPSASRHVNGACQFNEVGDFCSRQEDCFRAEHTKCSGSPKKCTCLSGFQEYEARFLDAVQGPFLTRRCVPDNEVFLEAEGDYCGDVYPSGFSARGLLCSSGLQCTACGSSLHRICTRLSDLPFITNNNMGLPPGQPASFWVITKTCTVDRDCNEGQPSNSMTCLRSHPACSSIGRCICSKSYKLDPFTNVCKKAIPIGAPCKNQYVDICSDSNAECVNGMCNCRDDWVLGPGGHSCQPPRIHLFHSSMCSAQGTWQCQGNLICDYKSGQCVCPPGQRVDLQKIHYVEYITKNGLLGRRPEMYHCVENKIGDSCIEHTDCILEPGSECHNETCICRSGFDTIDYIADDGNRATGCLSQRAPLSRENDTCGSRIDKVTRRCRGNEMCTSCGGDRDQMICLLNGSSQASAPNEFARFLEQEDRNRKTVMLHKLGDFCMNDADCANNNGGMICRIVPSSCGHYGTCSCALTHEDVTGSGICRPKMRQKCIDECSSSRLQCMLGICQCDNFGLYFNPKWHSLGAKIYTGPIDSSIDCAVWETQFYGDHCSDSSQCFRSMTCSTNRTCTCRQGYKIKPNNYECIEIDLGDACQSDGDCRFVENSRCSGASSRCECRPGYNPSLLRFHEIEARTEKLRCIAENQRRMGEGEPCSRPTSSSLSFVCQQSLVCTQCIFNSRDNVCLRPSN